MSEELVKRLLIRGCGGTLHDEAAAAIEHLTKERDEAREVLSGLALYLSVGSGDENTTADDYNRRIRLGIDMLLVRLAEARDAAIARAEAAEEDYRELAEERLAVRDEWATMRKDRDALRALLIETRPFVQDSVGFTHHELRARIAAATGDDNGK